MSFDEYAAHDDDVETCEPLTDEAITEAVVSQCDDGRTDPESSDDPLELDGMVQNQIWTPADSHKKRKSSGHLYNFIDVLLRLKLMFCKTNCLNWATEALDVVENALIKSTCQMCTF